MVDWDALEEAGHDLTHCGMLQAGTSLYFCERCGAFMLTRHEGIVVFHLPPHRSTQEKCWPLTPNEDHVTLKSKLKALQDADHERLKDI